MLEKALKRKKRHAKIRTIVHGTTQRPRVIVTKSNTRTYIQVVDDSVSKVIASIDTSKVKSKAKPVELCQEMGKSFGDKLIKDGLKEIVFDRNGYKYHGKLKAIATGLRDSGLKF